MRERLNAIAELARVARRSWESLGTSDRWRGGRREPVALRPRLSPGVPSRASRPTLRGGPKDVKNSPGLRFKAEQVCSISSSSYRQPWTPSPWLARRRFSSCMPSWNRWQSPPPAVLAATWLSWLASCECHGRGPGSASLALIRTTAHNLDCQPPTCSPRFSRAQPTPRATPAASV